MKMDARSRYAISVDVSVSVPFPQRGATGIFQTVACAAGGMLGDPLTSTLTLVQGIGEVCFAGLLGVRPTLLAVNPSPSNASAFCFRGSFTGGDLGSGGPRTEDSS